MNKNILKYFGLAALLALGVQTAEAGTGYSGYITLEAVGAGKVWATYTIPTSNKDYSKEFGQISTSGSNKTTETLGSDRTYEGAPDSKKIYVILCYTVDEANPFHGFFTDVACTQPLAENRYGTTSGDVDKRMTPPGFVAKYQAVYVTSVEDASKAEKIYALFGNPIVGAPTVSSFDELFSALAEGKTEMEIPAGTTVTIGRGQTIVIPVGTSLKIEGSLIVEGQLVNDGFITGSGDLIASYRTITQAAEVQVPYPYGADVVTSGKYVKTTSSTAASFGTIDTGVKQKWSVTVSTGNGTELKSELLDGVPAAVVCTVDKTTALNKITAIDGIYADVPSAIEAAQYAENYQDNDKLVVLVKDTPALYDSPAYQSPNALRKGFAIDCAGNTAYFYGNQFGSKYLIRFFNGPVTLWSKLMRTHVNFYGCSKVNVLSVAVKYNTEVSLYDIAVSHNSEGTSNVQIGYLEETGDEELLDEEASYVRYFGGGIYDAFPKSITPGEHLKAYVTPVVYWGTFAEDPTPYLADSTKFEGKLQEGGEYLVVEKSAAVAKVGGKEYETLAAAVEAADVGQTVEIIMAGEYAFPALPKNITITCCEGVVFNCPGSDNISSVPNGCTVNGGTFNMSGNSYHGWQHAGSMAFNGSTFNGLFFSYGNMTFTSCHFVQTKAEYNMWTYGGNISYVDCDFTFKGKCINVYRESATPYDVSFSGCTFNSDTKNKAAVNVKATCSNGAILSYTVNVTDCQVNDPAMFPAAAPLSNGLLVIDGLIQVDDIDEAHQPDNTTVFLNGSPAYPVVAKNFYQDETDKSLWHVANVAGLKEFRDSVNKGTSYANCTISIDADCDLTGEGYWTAIKAYVEPNLYLHGVTINGNGHTITGMRVANPAVEDGYNYGGGFIDKAGTSLTIKDLTFVNAEVQSVSGSQVAVVVGMSYGDVTLENVDIKNSTVTADTKAGAYVGQNDEGLVTFKDCDLINTVVKANYSAALFLGLANVSSHGWDFDANCSADENSKFEWVPGKWYKEKGDLSLYGRPYCLDDDVLVLTDSGEDCWAEKRTGEVRVIDGKDVTVWGSEFYPPYVESEPEVVPEKPTEEEAKEATKVVDDKGEEVEPSEQQAAAAKTEVDKVAQSFDNPEIAKVEKTGVTEAAMTVTGEGEEQKVVVKSAIVEELQKAAPGDTADQITSESDVKSYVKVALNEAKVAVKEEGAALKSVTFDVKPMAETTVTVGTDTTVVKVQIPNDEIVNPITFRLPLTDAFTVSAIVTHEGDPDRLCMVQGAPGGRYVEVTASHFSFFTVTPSEIVETTTESKTVLGIKRVDYTVTQSTADLAAAVPWLKAADEDMPVSQLITTGLSNGDTIQVYDLEQKTYYSWRYNGTAWEAVALSTGVEVPPADDYFLKRGRAFWYKPVGGKGASGTYTQVGLYSEASITSKVDSAVVGSASFAKPVHFLMASPKYEDFDLKEKLTADAGCRNDDVILIVATGKRLTFNGTVWCESVVTEVPRPFGKGTYKKTVLQEVESAVVPAGTAFWYLSAGGAPEFEW